MIYTNYEEKKDRIMKKKNERNKRERNMTSTKGS
jgi:hypothetical protein